MREPTYPIIVALALMLVAPPFSAFAQQDPPIVNPPIVNPPIVDLPIVAPPIVTPPIVTGQPLPPQTFGGRIDATAAAPPTPPQPKHAFYYHPGDLKGVPYNTIEDCTKARQRAGDVGVCMYK